MLPDTSRSEAPVTRRVPWNKGRLVDQKRPLKPKDVWGIRVRLEINGSKRDLALFNLAIDSKPRGCDLVSLKVEDVQVSGRLCERTTILQQKTGRPVQFELTEPTRKSVEAWIDHAGRRPGDYLFPSRWRLSPHLSPRQYARIVHAWVESAGPDSTRSWN